MHRLVIFFQSFEKKNDTSLIIFRIIPRLTLLTQTGIESYLRFFSHLVFAHLYVERDAYNLHPAPISYIFI